MSMCITIDRIDQKPKLSVVRTANGRQLKCWTDKIGKLGLEAGGTYNVETEDRPFGDSVATVIMSAKLVTQELNQSSTAARTSGQNNPSSASTQNAPFRTPEQMFVQGVVEAYIGAGKCANPGELKRAMQEALNAFRATWPDTEHYAQAAE